MHNNILHSYDKEF